ncbi:hypothetical protein RRG08_023488 [Elysia crispata]|uniref:Uncharacterized protein n=1 Tax=Elysia crispata TaxID=231223 RepID=A0AAE0YYP3_9GAST|nr:hypothetical protein RRG08_023488 [Elysia crispata]
MLLVSAGACFNELDLPQSPASCGVPRWRAALVELHGSPAKEINHLPQVLARTPSCLVDFCLREGHSASREDKGRLSDSLNP